MGREQAVEAYRKHLALMQEHEHDRYHELLAPLYGKDLACWCSENEACHADVLIEIMQGVTP